MPRQAAGEPLQKHTLHLFEGDYAELQSIYPEVGAAIIIRTLIRRHLREVSPKMPTLPAEVDQL